MLTGSALAREQTCYSRPSPARILRPCPRGPCSVRAKSVESHVAAEALTASTFSAKSKSVKTPTRNTFRMLPLGRAARRAGQLLIGALFSSLGRWSLIGWSSRLLEYCAADGPLQLVECTPVPPGTGPPPWLCGTSLAVWWVARRS